MPGGQTPCDSGGGSFESLYQFLKVLDRDKYSPVVVFLNSTRFVKLIEHLGIKVYLFKDLIYTRRSPLIIHKVFGRLAFEISRQLKKISVTALYFLHYPLIRDLVETARQKNIHLIYLNGQEILKRKLNIKWRCQSRVNIDLEILKLMKESGCKEISIGIETASPKVLKAIKKQINLDQAVNFLEASSSLNLSVLAYFMVSLPDETEEDAYTTLKFIKENTRLIYKPALQIAQIYPDAMLYYIAKEKGLLPEEFNWFSPYETPPHMKELRGREDVPYYLEHLSVDFLKQYLDQYYQYYFNHFFNKSDLASNLGRRLNTFVFDWKNESISRKLSRIKNGFRMIAGAYKSGS